jgi:hypothetical protein
MSNQMSKSEPIFMDWDFAGFLFGFRLWDAFYEKDIHANYQ